MMTSRQVRARIDTAEELSDIVGAVRAIAAVRVQRAAEAMDGVRRYADTIAGGLAQAIALLGRVPESPPPSPGRRLILFAAQHGFAGGLNDAVLGRGAREQVDALVVVGDRAQRAAAERGLDVTTWVPMATSLDMVEVTVRRLADMLAEPGPGHTDVLYVPLTGGDRLAPRLETVTPVALGGFRRETEERPLHYLEPATLVGRLAGEHVVAVLARAAVESFASENRARLRATDQAYRSIDNKLGELRALERQLRQDEITTELLDIITGVEAARLRRPA